MKDYMNRELCPITLIPLENKADFKGKSVLGEHKDPLPERPLDPVNSSEDYERYRQKLLTPIETSWERILSKSKLNTWQKCLATIEVDWEAIPQDYDISRKSSKAMRPDELLGDFNSLGLPYATNPFMELKDFRSGRALDNFGTRFYCLKCYLKLAKNSVPDEFIITRNSQGDVHIVISTLNTIKQLIEAIQSEYGNWISYVIDTRVEDKPALIITILD